jgi:hypothetical protein
MEKEKIRAWRAKLPILRVHVIERIDFRLDVVAVCSIGIKNFCARWWWIELTLLGLVVVIIMLTFMVNLVINVVDRIGKRIKVFLFMLFGHIRVVFFLFKSHFNWNTASMKISLSV